ncbi:hypothetical protein N7495_000495 [Penicillium taxi]|uniref:uncharacterized protein n=1 Tax=Penicillium taxi TaxID=168475 RepID=UPI002545014D|nr:uncharacterized protein N7495_000495 [Penicillium taxi]KAJ5907813.1 hypothetical protein N7495_000495 [Penicillium taxi]
MASLPVGYMMQTYSTMAYLRKAVDEIQKFYVQEKSHNQWLVVRGLSENATQQLDKDGFNLGVKFRFQWESTTGLIKVVPNEPHDTVTRRTQLTIHNAMLGMGMRWQSSQWMGTTTYGPAIGKGKQADDAFVPPPRCKPQVMKTGWPTLVIETGDSEGISQLRGDAAKWFADSHGEVRIVLIISIKAKWIDIEKWQLAPTNSPQPLTEAAVENLCAQTPNIPPLTTQLPLNQQSYCAQEVRVAENGISGTPLILPFEALYDRVPANTIESDVIISEQDLIDITELYW